MKLTRGSVHALHALAYLVEKGGHLSVASHEIAQDALNHSTLNRITLS